MITDRYSRQVLFAPIGEDGQRRLAAARICIIGCGALGSAQAEALARAGVGSLRLVDRDFVEESNLQRQTMFTERDARERLPKAIACVRRIKEINSETDTDARVTDARGMNVEELIRDCDAVLDGTDNFSTRYLINDACVKHRVNWVYGAAVGSYGVTMTVRPHITPCLRCVFEEMPPVGSAPTCDTAGVIAPIISIIAAVQVCETLKLLVGRMEDLHNSIMQFDVWRNEWRGIKLGAPVPDCLTCGRGIYETLDAEAGDFVTVLCGRDAVQISPPRAAELDLVALADRLRTAGEVKTNEYLVRLRTGVHELSIFQDGRAIIRGTSDAGMARSLYARYVGS